MNITTVNKITFTFVEEATRFFGVVLGPIVSALTFINIIVSVTAKLRQPLFEPVPSVNIKDFFLQQYSAQMWGVCAPEKLMIRLRNSVLPVEK